MWRVPLTLRVLALLVWCRHVRRNLGSRPLQLPSVAPDREADDRTIERQVRYIDRIVGLLTARSGHFCFYRSVILATVFRRQGLPLVVNVGGRSLGSQSKMKAHTWLTLEGKPFFEQPNAVELYPIPMGAKADGSVRYWVGPDFDDSILGRDGITRGNASRPDGPAATAAKG